MSILGNLFHLGSSAPASAQPVNPMLAHIVDTFGSALTDAPRYAEHLGPAILNAESYFERQIAAIPGPVNMSAQSYGRDERLDAIFPSIDELGIALGRSIEVKESLPALARAGHLHVHALLGFRYRHGDEVPGKPVVFADHTLKCLAPELDDARTAIRKVAFVRLIKNFSDHVDRLRIKGKLLAVEWNIANAAASAGQAGAGDEYVYAEKELTPDRLLRGLCTWLNDPVAHLRVCMGEFQVLGRKLNGTPPTRFELPMLHASDRRQWIVCLVRFPVHEGTAALAHETRAHRYILI
jgi:hypothetical protein